MYTWADKTTIYANAKVTGRALSGLGQCGHMTILDPFLYCHIPTVLFIPRDFCPRKSTLWCFYAAWALNVSWYLRIFSNFTWHCSVLKVNLPVALRNLAAVPEQCKSGSLSLSVFPSLSFCLPSHSPEYTIYFCTLGSLLCCDEGRRIIILLVGGNIWRGVPH